MAAEDLTTLEKVKAYLGQTVGTDDTLLGNLITAASAWIKSELTRDVTEATYQDVLDGTGTPKLVVPQFPVTALSAITVDGVALDPAKVVFRDALLARTDGGKFPSGYGNVVVSYTAGYSTPPADLDQACVQMVAWRYKERDRIGQSSKTAMGQGTVAYQTQDVPSDVRTLLKNWKKVVPA